MRTARSRPRPSPSWPTQARWLQGGELLLTIGLLLPDTVDGCRSYLTELDAAEVRAVGLGLGADLPHQGAPARLVAAADEIGMPLITVPDPVPFIAVTKAVFAHRARAERQELEWALQTQRALTAAAVTPGGLLGILAAHREATGRTGVVVDLLGRVLAESDAGGERLFSRLAGSLESVRGQGLAAAAADISDGRRRELHALGARRLRAWLLIDGPAELPAAHQVSGDLVSLLSLELERRYGLTTAQRRGRAQVLSQLARATVDDVVAARWLASVGLPDADLRVAAVVAPDDADDLAADLLITLPDALVRVVGEVVELAVPLDADLGGVLSTLAAGSGGRDRDRGAARRIGRVIAAGPIGAAGQSAAGPAHACRGDREQPVAAQRRWAADPAGLRRRGARAAGRDRPGRRVDAGVGRLS